MTNKSFLFQLKDQHYICRIPGPGTELLINRVQESEVYKTIQPLDISEKIIYMNGHNGYKIVEYYEGARTACADSREDMIACMKVLRRLHESGLAVDHDFDIRERILFYERLCMSHGGTLFEDYDKIQNQMVELMDNLDHLDRPKTLAHIDSNVDNFLILPDGQIRLIDWEYSGMCDPLADLGMCAIYSYYNEEEVEQLMDIYFERPAEPEERLAVYSYIALGGFLWTLWAVYKSSLGEEFGDYTLVMYRYAKRYYEKIKKM